MNSGKQIEKLINKVCNQKGISKISDIKMPLAIPSVDLCNGEVLCFTSVCKRNKTSDETTFINDIEIGKAVRASCSYPVVFSPCMYKNRKLVDGGIRENMPWKEVCALGADKVLSIMFKEKEKEKCADNLIEIAERSIGLIGRELSNYEMEGENDIVRIVSNKVGLLDMKKMDYLYELGYKQMKEYLNGNFKDRPWSCHKLQFWGDMFKNVKKDVFRADPKNTF